MSSLIPHARAPGLKRDGRILYEEDAARRAREAPSRDNWVLGPVPVGLAVDDQTTLSADLIRFYYLGQFGGQTQVAQARLNITTAAASQTVRSALYSYDTSDLRGRRLVKMPDSEAVFLAASTGVQTVGLSKDAITPTGKLFLGVKASNDAVGVGGLPVSTVSRAMPVYTYQDGAGVMAPIVAFTALAKSYTSKVLDVLYINHDAAQVL